LWQWIAQSPGLSATKSKARICADGTSIGDLRPRGGFRHPAAIGAGDLEIIAVHVDRVVGHGEIAEPDPHLVTFCHDKMIDAGETRGCSMSTC
jgi:hypothetical protein